MTNVAIDTSGIDDTYEAASARRPLRFLTDSDFRILLERAYQAHFVRGEVIIEEGSRRQAILLLLQEFVRVERSHHRHASSTLLKHSRHPCSKWTADW